MKKPRYWNLFCLSAVLFLFPAAAWSNIITNPSGLGTAVNTLGTTMYEEIGNIGLNSFNSLATVKQAFTFEQADGYPAPDQGNPASRVDRVSLTKAGGSALDLDTDIAFSGTNFGNLTSAFKPTGGTVSLVWNFGATADFTFSDNINGVGFTANRISGGSVTVQLFSDVAMTSQIGSDYTLADNTATGSEHSFFGYYDAGTNIRGLKLVHTGNSLFSVDDFTVAVVPEPSVGGLLLIGLLLVRRFAASFPRA